MARTEPQASAPMATDEAVPGQQVPVAPPACGETVRIPVEPGDIQSFEFSETASQVRLDGESLHLMFADGGKVLLDRFTLAANSDRPPVIAMKDGTSMAAAVVIAALKSLAAEPALVTASA